jgi:cobalamin biosynthesis protein CobT
MYQNVLEALNANETDYEKVRKELLPLIDQLENDLRDIFVQRRASKWKPGFAHGKRLSIQKRIQEKAKGVSVMESKSWLRKENPVEKDYDFELLIDLSGSMAGPIDPKDYERIYKGETDYNKKVDEAFKALVVLAEVLNRLSINIEVLGYNVEMHQYQKFGQTFDDNVRGAMGGMLQEVTSNNSNGNNDGLAVHEASSRLEAQKGTEKFLIVLSDGSPAPVGKGAEPEYDLNNVVTTITDKTKQKIIGLGIGPNTDHVSQYYPYSIPNIDAKKLAETLADLLRTIIADGDNL